MLEFLRWLVDFAKSSIQGASNQVLPTLLIALVSIAALFWAISKSLESLSKVIVAVGGMVGFLKDRFGSAGQKQLWINRRKQFLRVLETDLAGIAKSEAWNDQHFTDLEAEVEIDGEYYTSSFRRLIRRKSSGLRRVPSLMRAIDESSEKCLLLVGDPGAGKSVALRHFAVQLIERSRISKSDRALVPLYINLRELQISSGERITVDVIKKFVIDNVRHGDADTAEYVTSNWRDFQDKGAWFFLFDSFDEIPAVLHAAASDDVVAEYSDAIRKFMDGLGDCRGVVASREYKSPRSLQWPKLRILPLSEDLQEDLVNRTFLNSDQKQSVLRCVSTSAGFIYKNPLFLSLLCRYVRVHSEAPPTEHELLLSHVTSLARRDSRYVSEHWGLSGDQLLEGAIKVACLFAIDTSLGLSPTFTEIREASQRVDFFQGEDLIKLLEALSYVKIGRTDVQSSEHSSRRFIFGHRRYQEVLFAKAIMDGANLVPVDELIQNSRWREYLVALLQIGKSDIADEIIKCASQYLDVAVKKLKLRSKKYFGVEVRSFSWNDELLARVLLALQEGLRYREVNEYVHIAGKVNAIAKLVWNKGDAYDRLQVLRLCNSAPSDEVARRVEIAVSSGVSLLEEAAVTACKFVRSPTTSLAAWVRIHILSRLIIASRRFEYLKWEAVAMEMPSDFDTEASLAKARKVYNSKNFALSQFIPMRLLFRLTKFLPVADGAVGHKNLVREVRFYGVTYLYVATIFTAAGSRLLVRHVTLIDWLAGLIFALMSFYYLRLAYQVTFIGQPKGSPISSAVKVFKGRKADLLPIFLVSCIAISIGVAPTLIVFGVSKWLGWWNLSWNLFAPIAISFVMLFMFSFAMFLNFLAVRAKSLARRELASHDLFDVIRRAESGSVVVAACKVVFQADKADQSLRESISLLSAVLRFTRSYEHHAAPKWVTSSIPSDLRTALNCLMSKLDSV